MEKAAIRKFIYDRFPLAKSRKPEDSSRLLEEGVLDSLGVLELVNHLQEELGIPIEDEELVPENHHGSRSQRGTLVAAILYSLCETAKLQGLDPRAYLTAATKAAIKEPGAITMPEDLLKCAAS